MSTRSSSRAAWKDPSSRFHLDMQSDKSQTSNGSEHLRGSVGKPVQRGRVPLAPALLPGPGRVWVHSGPGQARGFLLSHGLRPSCFIYKVMSCALTQPRNRSRAAAGGDYPPAGNNPSRLHFPRSLQTGSLCRFQQFVK